MNLLAVLLFAASAFAQGATLTLAGPATAKAGQTISLTLSVAGASGASNSGTAGLQWGITLPPGYTANVAAGAVATAASKVPSCTADGSFCLLTGMNAALIGNGVAASISLKIPASAAGAVPLPLVKMLGVDAAGVNVAMTSGVAYTLAIIDRRDLNGDTKVDAADVLVMTNQVIASQANPAACVDDQNGDSKCDLVDVFNVVLKALGLIP